MVSTKWKRGSNVPKKPARWYRINKTTNKREVSPKARRYLSYKVKVRVAEKRLEKKKMMTGYPEKAYEERKITDNKIRVWAKFSTHRGAEPLYIECFIEGYKKDYERLKELLLQVIDTTFAREQITDEIDAGVQLDGIENFTSREGVAHINYKHSKNQRWQILK